MRKDSEIFLRKCLQYKTEIGEDAFELNITYFGEIPNIEVEIDEIINELKTLKCISKKIVKKRIEGGANEKAVLRLFINCPFVCINFDFFWLNKARQLYMDF